MWTHIRFLTLLVVRNLRRNKTTAAVLALGYAVGWLFPAYVLAALNFEWNVLRDQTMIAADRTWVAINRAPVVVSPFSSEKPSGPTENELLERLKSLDPSIEQVSYRAEIWTVLSYQDQIRYTYVLHVDRDFDRHFKKFLSSGSWHTDWPALAECVLGSRLAKQLVGKNAVGRRIAVAGESCLVVGVTDLFPDRAIVIDEEGAPLKGVVYYYVRLKDKEAFEPIRAKILHLKSDLLIEPATAETRRAVNELYRMGSIAFIFSIPCLIYFIINSMNIIYLLFLHRKGKMGVQLALGARRRDLYAEMFSELLAVTTVSMVVVFAVLALVGPVAALYLRPIRIDAAVVTAVLALHVALCALLAALFTRPLPRRELVGLIREVDG